MKIAKLSILSGVLLTAISISGFGAHIHVGNLCNGTLTLLLSPQTGGSTIALSKKKKIKKHYGERFTCPNPSRSGCYVTVTSPSKHITTPAFVSTHTSKAHPYCFCADKKETNKSCINKK